MLLKLRNNYGLKSAVDNQQHMEEQISRLIAEKNQIDERAGSYHVCVSGLHQSLYGHNLYPK